MARVSKTDPYIRINRFMDKYYWVLMSHNKYALAKSDLYGRRQSAEKAAKRAKIAMAKAVIRRIERP